jgi:hypothetical protein
MSELRWLDDPDDPETHRRVQLQRKNWWDCILWLESLGNAEDEWTAGWMRVCEKTGGHPIPNLTLFRRVEAAMARWRARS